MKSTKKIVAAILCACMLFALTSCAAANRTPVFSYEDQSITSDYYSLILSYQKGYYMTLFNYYYGIDLSANPEQWETEYSKGVTLADQITSDINDYCRIVLICNYLAAKYGIEVTKEDTLKEIDDTVSSYVANYGGDDLFAVELAKIGADKATFLKFLDDSYRVSLVQEHLYGENGIQKVPAADVEDYFLKNYKKVDSMSFSYYALKDGSETEYETYIADFTTNEISAYFAENYIKCNYLYYEKGKDEKDDDFKARTDEVLSQLSDGSKTFADLKSSADGANADWVVSSSKLGADVFEKAKSAELGEWISVSDDGGIHIICRAETAASDLTETVEKECKTAMSRKAVKDYAEKYLEDVKAGTVEYGKELKTDFYTAFVNDSIFTESDMSEDIMKAYNAAKEGEYFMVETTDGVFVLYKDTLVAADAKTEYTDSYSNTKTTYYADIETTLSSDAFYKYMESFFDSITIDKGELGKYDIRTAIEFYD